MCGCAKSKKYTQLSPMVVGEPDEESPIMVHNTIAMMSMRAGSEFWVTGSGVDAMIDAGWLLPA